MRGNANIWEEEAAEILALMKKGESDEKIVKEIEEIIQASVERSREPPC